MELWISILIQLTVFYSTTTSTTKKTYNGYKVYKINARNNVDLGHLQRFYDKVDRDQTQLEYDFWRPPSAVGLPVEVLASPLNQRTLDTFLVRNKIPYEVVVNDLQQEIRQESQPEFSRRGYMGGSSSGTFRQAHDALSKGFDFSKYHQYGEIQQLLEDLKRDYPHLVSLHNIGTTHENRTITLLKVVMGYDSDPELKQMLGGIDLYFLPVHNPDGYEYSHTNDRMWRKNRAKNLCSTGKTKGWMRRGVETETCHRCRGVDLNRNYDWHHLEKGASSNPCSEVYAGTEPFSEPETRAVRDFVIANKGSLKSFITLHSFDQTWLYPFGHARRVYPSNIDQLVSDAISGGSDDWALGVGKIDLVYLIELRPSNTFRGGFVLPPSQIGPTAEETWAGLKIVADEVVKIHPTIAKKQTTAKQIVTTKKTPTTEATSVTTYTKQTAPVETTTASTTTTTATTTTTTATTTTTTATTTTTTKPRLGLRNCKDESRGCGWWKFFRRCDEVLVKQKCKKSCNICVAKL